MNCPFYGRYAALLGSGNFPILIDSHGNQCALITSSFAPCIREHEGLPVDWQECELLQIKVFGGASDATRTH